MADNCKMLDGKKYMWDGIPYSSEEEAREKMGRYRDEGFETVMMEGDDGPFLYTRRVVTEIVVEGAPPA